MSALAFTLKDVPRRVDVYEVGPRDGLQNELRILGTADKLRLIQALVASGERRIEVTSFVSPAWIPQLADAEALLAQVPRRAGVTFSALVPNLQGLERAKRAGVDEIAAFLSVTESHSRKNINKSVAEAIVSVREVIQVARQQGFQVRCYLSTVWGCPYEGLTPVTRVVEIVQQMMDCGAYQLSLSDTIGVGTPAQTADILGALLSILKPEQIALHLHDTRGTALANALVGLAMGISTFDTSVGGLGGCPYAPGAAGNLATEDLLYMLQGMGIDTGMHMERLVEAGRLAQELIGRTLGGKYLQSALAHTAALHVSHS